MGRTIGADEPGAIDGEAHGQVLDAHVVHDLIVGALKKRRVDRAERLIPFCREAGSEGDRVLLGDADVEAAVGERLVEQVEAGAVGHGGVDRHDLVVAPGFRDQRVGEHLGVGGRVGLGFELRAGDDVEGRHGMVLFGRRLGRRVALALLRHDVDEDRPRLRIAHVLQDGQQVIEVVAVDRADVVEAELLEHRAAGPEVAGELLRLAGAVVDELRQVAASCLAASRTER